MNLLGRRGFLSGLAAAAAMAATRRASASTSTVRSMDQDERGTTLHLSLENAPFPAPGAGYKDDTVIAFVPSHYRYASHEQVSLLVHFHGHSTTADRAMAAHELRGQLDDSKQNAILLVPQGPVFASDSSCGKLEVPGGLSRMLDDALAMLASREVRAALGPAAIPEGAFPGRVCLSAHSGGYHAAACGIRAGGVEIHELYLFDALYADVDVFKSWVIAGRGRPQRTRHKLVSFYTEGTTATVSRQLCADLCRAGVRCASETVEGTLSREEITLAEAVFVHTGLWHSEVTYETNALRDCLFASSLPRHLRATWFARKTGARPLERRR
jgi:hypothetical protein